MLSEEISWPEILGPQAMETVLAFLDRIGGEGYEPRQVFLDVKQGCRGCGTTNGGKDWTQWTKFMVTMIGARLEGKEYPFAFVWLCKDTCLQSPSVREAMAQEVAKVFNRGDSQDHQSSKR